MTSVSIVGAGMTAVGEHWARGIVDLAEEAAMQALDDAGAATVDAIIVGNAYGATFNQQTQLGSRIASQLRMPGVEAYTCEAGDASGGVALRAANLAVASGAVGSALVVGAEKTTDIVAAAQVAARTISLDAEYEAVHGATLTTLAALLMRRYMHEHGADLADFEGFSVNAHRNGASNPRAMFRNRLREGAFGKAPMLADPVSLFDCAPDADGAAALVLVSSERAADLALRQVEICGSAVATDTLALQDRADPLFLSAVRRSTDRALDQAGVDLADIGVMELHDAFTVLTALSLEAMGLAERGRGTDWARDQGGRIALDGELPLSAFGGLKSRGNPSGATGLYQAAEAALQLRGQAGANQVSAARWALIQNIGGLGATVVTHILRACD